MRKVLLIVIVSNLLLSSCATILSGTKQKVIFNSSQEGKVYQNLTEIGKTNTEIRIKRRDLVKLYTIKAEGCNDKQIELPISINPFYYINIPLVFTGVGLLTAYFDVAYGCQYKTEKIINVTLDCNNK